MSRDQLKRLGELETENTRLRRAVSDLTLDKMILTVAARGPKGPRSETSKPFPSASMYRPGAASFDAAQGALRSTGRRTANRRHHCADRRVRTLCTARQAIAQQSAERGYRMITGMLNNSGWYLEHKRVERLRRREGLKVPQKQPKKGRAWLNHSRDIASRCPAGQGMEEQLLREPQRTVSGRTFEW